MTPALAAFDVRPSSRSQARLRRARLAIPTLRMPRRNASGTANDASRSTNRFDSRATATAAGIVRTPAMPSTTAAQALRLLLSIGPATRRGRDRPADHAGDSDQGQHVRQRTEEHGLARPRLLEPERQRVRESEQEGGRKSTERPPVPEDERRQADEAAAGGHVLVERADVTDRQVRAAERGEHPGDDDRAVASPVNGNPDGVGRARMLADRPDAQADRRPEHDDRREEQQEEAQD